MAVSGGAKSIAIYALLFAGVAALLYLLPRGDWMLSDEQRQGATQESELMRITAGFDDHRLLFEIGSASAYASGCGMELNDATVSNVLSARALKPSVFEADDPHYPDLVKGVRSVADLLAVDGGWSGNRNLTCSLGLAAYGKGGTLVPLLLSGSR